MIVVDENFVAQQCERLRVWRIPFRQIGTGVGRLGMQDEEIVPLLMQLPSPTLFTRDLGWYRRSLVHPRYSVIVLAVQSHEAALFTRRALHHPELNTQAKRLAKVVRASHDGLAVWSAGEHHEAHYPWP